MLPRYQRSLPEPRDRPLTQQNPLNWNSLSGYRYRDFLHVLQAYPNAVIYHNTALLSRIYAQKQAAGDVEALEILRHISPVAWQHIHLFGRFEFTQTGSRVDLDALAERYNDPDFWDRALREGGLDELVY